MVIVDSGFWLALANKRDTFHQQAIDRFPEFQPEGFITTWCVITETCYLLQQRVGLDAPVALLDKVSISAIQVVVFCGGGDCRPSRYKLGSLRYISLAKIEHSNNRTVERSFISLFNQTYEMNHRFRD